VHASGDPLVRLILPRRHDVFFSPSGFILGAVARKQDRKISADRVILQGSRAPFRSLSLSFSLSPSPSLFLSFSFSLPFSFFPCTLAKASDFRYPPFSRDFISQDRRADSPEFTGSPEARRTRPLSPASKFISRHFISLSLSIRSISEVSQPPRVKD